MRSVHTPDHPLYYLVGGWATRWKNKLAKLEDFPRYRDGIGVKNIKCFEPPAKKSYWDDLTTLQGTIVSPLNVAG